MMTIAEINDPAGPLAELLKQVKAGNDVLLTQDNQPVARLIPAIRGGTFDVPLRIRSLKGHKILTPFISQSEIAEELFNRQ